MKICGIICEYNPFHNGHRYHIQKAREYSGCDVLVCVMSGNFVQRGEPAICDKWKRAQVAIENGCDLVVELPFPFVVQSGECFAYGAIEVLKHAGIDTLVFGSECDDLNALRTMSEKMNSEIELEKGISSAKVLELRVGRRVPSNDMLALFYLKALKGSTIQPICIKRTNDYNSIDTDKEIASAKAIRYAFAQGEDISKLTCMNGCDFKFSSLQTYYPYLQHFLNCASKAYLSSLFLVDEGIESLFKKQSNQCVNYDQFLSNCISRRYTQASIQRTLIHILTQTTKAEMNTLTSPDYLRPLAYNECGQHYLRTLQKQEKTIVSLFKQLPLTYQSLEMRATSLFAYGRDEDERTNIIKRELLNAVIVK